jgi:hypothetical protein
VKRARTLLPRLLGAAGLTAALVVAVTAFSGIGAAAPTAAQAEYAPTNTTPPSITGTPQVGQVLTAQPGTWTSTTTPTFAYQWQRCNTTGAACANITGATSQTYTVQTADQGATLRVQVTATNTGGSTQASSPQTAIVQGAAAPPPPPGPAGAIKLANGQTSIPASSVTLPNRLIIDGVRFSPNPIRSRGQVQARFHVSDSNGNVVRDALVYAIGLPYGWTRNGPEATTNQAGYATVTLTPTRNLPVGHRNALVVFVRARVEGQNLLAGSSTRRLVQASVR